MKNILFRADSSSAIGIGHIMRDLVLAEKYKEEGYSILFATQNLIGNINIEIKYEIKTLSSNSIDELQKIIKKYNIDMIVIDHYHIDYDFEKELKTQNKSLKILSFDDTYERHYCDVLLNHNISADKDRYKALVPSFCEIRCGSKYTLLREEFYKEKEIKRDKIYDILLAMGGADTANLNIKILESLPKEFKVAIVTTKANKNLEELKEYTNNKGRENISLFINSNEVAKLINQSKMAIVTPSVSVNEVLFLDVRFIAIKTAENQRDIYEYLVHKNYNVFDKFSVYKLHKFFQDIKKENFIDLSLDEQKMVLGWRNHNEVRKWMFTNEIISLENHLKYIASLSTKTDKKYFLIRRKNVPIGVIDFTKIDEKEAYIGLYASPKIKGVGNILMQEIILYGFEVLKVKKLISEVLENNLKAIKLYEKRGFKIVKKEEKLLIMELKNENS